ncbi:unnamed protein product [Sphagnum balticum]
MAKLLETYACAPSTERGRGILVSGDAKSGSIVYCNGRSVIIRSLANPLNVEIYGEHAYPTTVAKFSPNGEWIASGDASGQVRIWARNEEHTLKFEIRALSGSIDDLDWSFDGQRIVVCGDGKGSTFVKAFLWDSGSTVGEFDGHSKRVLSCAFKPNRPFRIATCGEDFLVNFYEGPPFRFKTSHREHLNFVNCVRFSPNGSKFLTVGSDKKGFIFNGKTGEKLGDLSGEDGHTGSIYAACWSSDGEQVLTVSADKTAKIWDISEEGNGKVSTTFQFSDIGGAEDMQVGCLWMGEYLITVSLGGIITYLSKTDPNCSLKVVSGHLKSITALTVAKLGESGELYSSSYDGVIVHWRVGSGYAGRLEKKGTVNRATHMVARGDELLTCGMDNKLWRVMLSGNTYGDTEATDLELQPQDLDVTLSSSDVVVVPTKASIIILHGSTVISKTDVGYQPSAAAISPDGSEIVVGGQDGKLYIYSVKGDTLIQESVLERHRGALTAVRFSPDGTMIASGDQNREAVVWDRGTREVKMKNMLYHTARINTLAWSPDSLKVATASVDSCVYVYDVTKPVSARITLRNAHLGSISALAFLDSQTFASGGDDACIRLWTLH